MQKRQVGSRPKEGAGARALWQVGWRALRRGRVGTGWGDGTHGLGLMARFWSVRWYEIELELYAASGPSLSSVSVPTEPPLRERVR